MRSRYELPDWDDAAADLDICSTAVQEQIGHRWRWALLDFCPCVCQVSERVWGENKFGRRGRSEIIFPLQTFLPHILYHFITYFGKEDPSGKAGNVLASKSNGICRAVLSMCDVSSLPAAERGAADISLNKSVIQHKDTGKGLRYYDRSLVYSHLRGRKQLKKSYWEGMTVVSEEQFSMEAYNISCIIVDGRDIELTAWTFSAP